MAFSEKQKEYFKNANHRWNIKSGATRSGKTYMDYFVIPKRLRSVSGKEGLNVILGHTKGTLQRNIIEPLQNIWGIKYVSDIKSDNTAYMFGEKVYCLGADKITQVDKIRGSSIKYCYGDETVTWNEEVFNMLKSRLDKEYSRFDGTCNPDNPNHWFKKFIDSDADIYHQKYTLDDNPFNSEFFKNNLKKEYAGTVFYDRYILGEWVAAEGHIYPMLANNPDGYYINKSDLPQLAYINIGVDFGGNKSNHAIVATGMDGAFNCVYALKAWSLTATGKTVEYFVDKYRQFVTALRNDFPGLNITFADSNEQTIINSMRQNTTENITNALKNPIIDRIRCTDVLLCSNRLKFIRGETKPLIEGLKNALWDSKQNTDTRLDNGTSDIDILDAFEYSFEYYIPYLLSR